MQSLEKNLEITYFGLSQPDALIHEILKPSRPIEYYKQNIKVPLKYKDPEVSIIKKMIIKNIYMYRKYLFYLKNFLDLINLFVLIISMNRRC